jgi:hypothetical protein
MSKARALFKKLRNKANQEKQKERNETPEPGFNDLEPIPKDKGMRVQSAPKILKKAPEKDEDEIDPLDYFKTEHIKIEPSDMKEYATKEELEEEEKSKEVHKNINEVIIDTKTGMMGPTSHKINFMEMMKARNKVKKTNEPVKENEKSHENKKNLSVDHRKNNIGDEDEEENRRKKIEKRIKVKSVEKNSEDNTQSLYVKLVLARNRYNINHLVTEENVYQNIMNLVDEFNSIKDMPQEMSDEINSLLQKLELPQHLIIDKDVQDYIPEDQFVPLISNPTPLDQIIKQLNLTEN